MGALVENPQGALFGLSNNHIFGDCNHAQCNSQILSPSNMDAAQNLPPIKSIAKLTQVAPLHSAHIDHFNANSIDAAIALIVNPTDVSSWQGDKLSGYDTPISIIEPTPGLKVKKIGRTTGLTTGFIESKIFSTHIGYKSKKFAATCYFEDVFTIRGDDEMFADCGDSGSLVVTDDGQNSVGLIFAVSPDRTKTFAIKISKILSFFNVSLRGGHELPAE